MKNRETGIDYIKVVACILVVLGHFFQSMIKSGIIIDNNVWKWFEETIYKFHVPLFFICSGYVYQRYGKVNSFQEWKRSVIKKLITLGVPYITFSVITWLLKTIFSNSVNDGMKNGLLKTVFLLPTSPYWYLYTLLLIFFITPTFKRKRMMVIFVLISVISKLIMITGVDLKVYALISVLSNEVWFVLGMVLSFENINMKIKEKGFCTVGIIGICLFVLISIVAFVYDLSFYGFSFVMGLMACMSIFVTINALYYKYGENDIMKFLSKYTMPIFLMHTIFAAPARMILIKLGILNSIFHVIIGLVISIVGPIIASIVMKRFKWMEFWVYPGKYIKL